MGIFNLSISFINKFLSRFKPAFSNKQFIVFSYLIYALFKDYKRNSICSMSSNTPLNYQSTQYFLSEANCSHDKLNDVRLKLIENQRTTSSTHSGVLVIDDTASPKPYAKNTQGAKYQYCGVLGRDEVCNTAIFSTFASKSKHCPINFKSYLPADEFSLGKKDPSFKSKIQLAQILIEDTLNKNINFSSIVMDAWYTQSSELLLYPKMGY